MGYSWKRKENERSEEDQTTHIKYFCGIVEKFNYYEGNWLYNAWHLIMVD